MIYLYEIIATYDEEDLNSGYQPVENAPLRGQPLSDIRTVEPAQEASPDDSLVADSLRSHNTHSSADEENFDLPAVSKEEESRMTASQASSIIIQQPKPSKKSTDKRRNKLSLAKHKPRILGSQFAPVQVTVSTPNQEECPLKQVLDLSVVSTKEACQMNRSNTSSLVMHLPKPIHRGTDRRRNKLSLKKHKKRSQSVPLEGNISRETSVPMKAAEQETSTNVRTPKDDQGMHMKTTMKEKLPIAKPKTMSVSLGEENLDHHNTTSTYIVKGEI